MRLVRRVVIKLVLLGASCVALGAGAQSASAACYFVNGGCGSGWLAAGQTTPWTGNWTSTTEYMSNVTGAPRTMTIGVRPCGTCAGTTYTSGQPILGDLIVVLGTASRQRWCRNAGGSGGNFICHFS